MAITNHKGFCLIPKSLPTRRNKVESGAEEEVMLLTGMIVAGHVTGGSLSKHW